MKNFFKLFKYIDGTVKIKGSNNYCNPNFILENKVYMKIQGNNNQIITGKCKKCNLSIQIYGDNNKIYIADNAELNGMVDIGFEWHNKVNNAVIKIGKNTSINAVSMVVLEPESKITIGEDCMLASKIEIWASDTHSITDVDDNLLNYGGDIEIGNHVWIGKGVKISKNVKIADNSIVGWWSVVTSKFDQKNIVIAGNPARVVKENIKWNRLSPFNYKQSNNELCEINN